MASKRSPVTYLWRTKRAPGWAAAVRLLPTVDGEGGEERTSIDAWECNGAQHGLSADDKSDVVLIPCCLGNGGQYRGGLVLCQTYLAAGGAPTETSVRPVLEERLSRDAVKVLGLQVGFTVSASLKEFAADVTSRADPTWATLTQALMDAHLNIASLSAGEHGTLEIVIDMGDPLVSADHCELVQAICARFRDTKAKVTEVWVSTAASRGEQGAAGLLTRLTAASSGAGVSANSRVGRFYIPASVARKGSGHYIDQKPAPCENTYQYVLNVADLWADAS